MSSSNLQIILRESIRGLGASGSIVKVKRGYFRNYLSRLGKAVIATKANIENYNAQRDKFAQEAKEKLNNAQKLAESIGKENVILVRTASESGKLFGSVKPRDIANDLVSKGYTDVTLRNVYFSDAIRNIGEHKVIVSPYGDASATISVHVVRSQAEAEEFRRLLMEAHNIGQSESMEYQESESYND